jgi:ABC-type multidrug transport system fused ATPase/permease subunit
MIPTNIILSFSTIYIPKIVIELLIENNLNMYNLLVIFMYFLGILVVSLINRYCDSRIAMRQYSFSLIYQRKITEKFMKTDFSNTDNPDINIKYFHAMNDACSGRSAAEFVLYSIMFFLINIFGLFLYGSIIISISPLFIVLLITSAVLTYSDGLYRQKYYEKNKDEIMSLERKVDYIERISSEFEYAKDIRLYQMSGWLSGILGTLQKERYAWTKKESKCSFISNLVGAILTLIQEGMAYIVLINMVNKNEISIADFVLVFGAIAGFSQWLSGIVENIRNLSEQSVRIGYYRDYFDIKDKYNHGKGCKLPSSDLVEINFINVSYQYPSNDKEQYTLNNINLKINKGEHIAIVGANGAGKTTFVKLLCGLYLPTEGSIKVNEKSIEEYNIEEYYSLFSPVFQDMYVLPVSIAEFIASSDTDIDEVKLDNIIKQVGLNDKIESLPNGIYSMLVKGVYDDAIDLSGGERQKLMLARALYKDKFVIVLDEPTSSLDPIAENDIYMKYSELVKGKTSIFISHRLASTRFCDRIVLFDDGKIAEIGTHDELMSLEGKYAQMFKIQSQYYREVKEGA